MSDEFYSPETLAEWLGVPRQSVYSWRTKRTGPPAIRVGKHVRYRKSAVEAWLAEQADDRPQNGKRAPLGRPVASKTSTRAGERISRAQISK